MEKLRRALKVFWTEHGTPILFWVIVISVIFIIIQALNRIAIIKDNNKNQTDNQVANAIEEKSDKEDSNYTDLIENFIDLCKNNKIDEAYELLSDNCKKDLYPTVETFKNNYYNKLFNKGYDIQAEYLSDNKYSIKFYENILQSGKVDNRDYIEDTYKIEEEIIETKIYINLTNSIK